MRKTVLRLVTGVLLIGWMTVIFLFSHQPAVTSSEISGGVSLGLVGRLDALFDLELPEETLEKLAQMIDYPVRKAAHMTEYAVLGLLAFAFSKPWRRDGDGITGRRGSLPSVMRQRTNFTSCLWRGVPAGFPTSVSTVWELLLDYWFCFCCKKFGENIAKKRHIR